MDSTENSISLPFKEDPACSKIKTKVRQALLALGNSPDLHIYEWNDDFLSERSFRPEARYLQRAKRFYEGLDPFQKRVLISECLEFGRVYPFWYYGWGSEPAYRKERKAVLKALKAEIE